MMKRVFIGGCVWLSVLLPGSVLFSGCSSDESVPREAQASDSDEQRSQPTALEILSRIEGVTVELDTIDADKRSIVYFYYDQPVDHDNPSAGTFRQHCAFHYEHPDSLTVLHTQGYSMPVRKVFNQQDLSRLFGGNYIEVEHRYFQDSPVGDDNGYREAAFWQYNTARQATADLHRLVSAMKLTGNFRGKWLSTGTSKNGILTALYAYYYPNEMNVYVPVCAPFCTGLETDGIGRWVTEQCGKGTSERDRIWALLRRLITDEDLRESLAARYKEEKSDKPNVQRYSTRQIMYYVIYRYMVNVFSKFTFRPLSEWGDVVPYENSSDEVIWRFLCIHRDNFLEEIGPLRVLCQMEMREEEDYYDDETYDDYEEDDWEEWEDDGEWDGGGEARRAARAAASADDARETVVKDAYKVQAAMELGYFLYDWSLLTGDGLITDDMLRWLQDVQTIRRYSRKYGVEWDGGRLMTSFLDFVANNRYRDRCRMLFIYGANDPWTGAAIPDPAPDDPCVVKHVVPGGAHSGKFTNPKLYPPDERDFVVSTVRRLLR